ncbi:MAG: hypothetical protein IKO03_14375 [Lachnospiraceae bacterium]|nr:hypothetical protein [Lachnospiraceae bacterium]
MERLRMAYDLTVMQGKKTILRVFMTAAAFCLMFAAIMLREGIGIGEKTCKSILIRGTEGYANIVVRGSDDEIRLLPQWALELPEVGGIGNMVDYGSSYQNLGELKRIQAGHIKEQAIALNGQLEIKIISPSLLDLCDFKLKEGTEWKNLKHEVGVKYLYLGSAFESVAVGTRYSQPVGGDLVVAGVLSDGMKWISCDVERLSHMSALATLDYVEDLTYDIFVVSDELCSNQFVLFPSDGYDINDAITVIRQEAERRGLSISAEPLSSIFEEGKKETVRLTKGMISLSVICLMAGMLISVSFVLMEMLDFAKSAGILMTTGFSSGFVKNVFFIKEVMLTLISLALSLILSVAFAKNLFYSDGMQTMFDELYLRHVIPFGCLLAAAEMAVSFLTVGGFLRSNPPVKLIRMN